jgi:hypothetical protein
MHITKNLIILLFTVSIFQSCQKSPAASSSSNSASGIYITFQNESAVTSYTDNNPNVGSNMSGGSLYGPCVASNYYYA